MRRPLLTRLERLEAGCRQIVADRCRNIDKAAFTHLSHDQKKCLLAAIKSYQQGRPWTSEEAAVVNAFNTAMEEEGRKAGITIAQYSRYSRQAVQP